MQTYPRVLFVTPVAFNPFAGGGATFTSLFTGWPKDCLATIHNDINPTPNDVCENYYALRADELDFIEPFGSLRRRMRPNQESGPNLNPSSANSWLNGVRKNLLGDSVPERSRLTPELDQWIAEYRPQVIYTILGGNGMMSLIEKIRSRFCLPLVVHVMDDWSATAHRHGLFAPIERFRMNRWLKHFFNLADDCLGISPAMCEAYTKRYRRPFTAFQYTLDVDRWSSVAKRDLDSAQPPEFLYIGSIFPDAQLQSLIDCAQAVCELNQEGFHCKLRIVTSATNITRYRRLLELNSTITMPISDADEPSFFRMLAAADVLLLPVNFDDNSVNFIRYSMPTKVPSYLASGTPCLVYGSGETAQVRYALDSGWGHVITQRSMPILKEGLRRIATDMSLRRRLSEAAHGAAINHDVNRVRPAFHDVLRETAAKPDPSHWRADMSGWNQSERTRNFFDETAGGWSSRYDRDSNMALRRKRFAEALQPRLTAPADVLDFGCGSGVIGRHLAGYGYRMTGCDLSAAMIEQARAADLSHSAKWVALEKVPPAALLPFDDSSFDAVISSSVLEYVGTVDTTLAEVGRILRPGGWVLATVPDMRSPSRQRELWFRRAATIPLLAAILDHSRWREGARYQRISINRWPGAKWYAALEAADFRVDPLPECTGPLVLLSARKLPNKS